MSFHGGLLGVMIAFAIFAVRRKRRIADDGYLFGGWFTMGMLLTLPMLLVGGTLMYMAYRRREPSGNYSAAAQPA
jgi:prolipoprotein diacylglyceryltransferase